MRVPTVPLSDVIRDIAAVRFAHVRLAVTQNESSQWVLRSLLVEVFPQPWLDKSGEHLAEWSDSDELNDYGRVVFFAGFVPTEDVREWFADQPDCTLRNFDPRLGHRTRVIRFHIPELQPHASSEYVYGHTFDGYPTMPWPHTTHVCTMKSPTPMSNADYSRLVAPNQRLYRDFPTARAKLIHGVSDPNRSHQFEDRVAVRRVTAEGWLQEVRVADDSVTVAVRGMALRGSRLILTGAPEFDDTECEVNRPGQYKLAIPCAPTELEVALVRGHVQLDDAVYRLHLQPFAKLQPHVIRETRDVTAREAHATEHASTSAQPGTAAAVSKQVSPSPEQQDQSPAKATNKPRSKPATPPAQAHSPVVLRVVVASPGDVKAERDCLPRVLEEVNHGLAGQLGLQLDLWRWETDASPGFNAAGPQGRIDAGMRVEDSEIVIGIFWRRFGTPVQDAQSGTEHELRRAINAWRKTGRPHVMVYFSRRPYSPLSTADLDQWRAVLSFKEQFPAEGLWWSYRGPAEFERFVRRHLEQYLRDTYGRIN